MYDLHRRLEEQGQERLLFVAPTRNAKRLIESLQQALSGQREQHDLTR